MFDHAGCLRVGVPDEDTGELMQAGWIDGQRLIGKTMVDYDWTEKVEE